MAGLCEGGNEPPGSLKASNDYESSLSLRAGSQLMSGMQILAALCIKVDWKKGWNTKGSTITSVYEMNSRSTVRVSVMDSKVAVLMGSLRAHLPEVMRSDGSVDG
ncbi:hypothetical protein ANN_23172 [Periplaneta americana]|uniref:Uncharacterized protein n=1 Tax=Periplaneta americana TaxID=6978 RepID=A0ABQ8SMD5_PERAM|nr:hypothetical protein ANN_23172 [Periplaneta americana]